MQQLNSENQFVLMTRDPHMLYAFWDISLHDTAMREKSEPFMKVINITQNKSFYVKISDNDKHCFIPVTDTDCIFTAELVRKSSNDMFITVAKSGQTYVPRDSFSNETKAYFADYRDLKKVCLRESDRLVIKELNTKKLNTKEDVKSFAGVSSEQFYNSAVRNFANKHLGISSDSFVKG